MTKIRLVKIQNALILVVMLVLAQSVIAQDKILTTRGETINCRVTKVGAEYVEYLDTHEVFGKIKKAGVKHIEFSKTPREPIDYSKNTKKAIKINLLSLTNNALQISYEKAIDALTSLEVTAKIYGVSVRNFETRKIGGGIDIGYRFRLGDFIDEMQRKKHAHVLDGIGLKPTLGGSYAETDNEGAIEKYYYFHLGSVINYQAIFNNKILFEIYGGLHVFKGNSTVQLPNTPLLTAVLDFQDGDLNGSDNVAFSYGLKFGYLFGGFGRSSKLLRW